MPCGVGIVLRQCLRHMGMGYAHGIGNFFLG